MSLITKSDFPALVDFTTNTTDAAIDFQIDRAINFDFKPLVDIDLFLALKSFAAVTYATWAVGTPYITNDKKIYASKYYIALQNSTGQQPDISPLYWKEIELSILWKTYLVPYLVLSAYIRHLVKLGANATQFGLVQNREDTSEPVSGQRRSEILGAENSIMETYKTELFKYLSEKNYTFDTIKYDSVCLPKRSGGFNIRAI